MKAIKVHARRQHQHLPPESLWRDLSFDFLFKSVLKTAIFGRSLAQLIVATLLLCPVGIKEGPKRLVLSSVPLRGFSQDSLAP